MAAIAHLTLVAPDNENGGRGGGGGLGLGLGDLAALTASRCIATSAGLLRTASTSASHITACAFEVNSR
jgi:phage replication-related protein YjqB (UPF0714/DUF867 family)